MSNFHHPHQFVNQEHQILSMLTHEIRNPLTLIYSNIQLLETRHPELKNYGQWSYLTEDVEFIIQLLQDFSSYNNGEILTLSRFDFSSFMKPLALSFASSLIGSDISFASHIPDSLPPVAGDSVKLKEVFLNLLQNAKEAVGTSGSIMLHTSCDGKYIIVQIEDTGGGVPDEMLPFIFMPFVTGKKDGTGLGLAIAKQIIDAHHGTIEVLSSVKNGCVFTLRIPIAAV